jgi:hypothetical protein
VILRALVLVALLLWPSAVRAQLPAGDVTIQQGGNRARVNAFGQLSITGALVPGLTPGSAFAFQPGGLALGLIQAAPVYGLGGLQPLSLTPFGALRIDGSGVVQPVSLSTFGVFNTTQPTWTTGQGVSPQATSRGALIVGTGADTFNVTCSNCSGSGVSQTDEAAFVAGTTLFATGGGFFQTTATNNALTNLQMGTFQVTAQRALFVNSRDASGTEIATAANPYRIDPTGTTTQPVAITQGGNTAAVNASSQLNVNCAAGCSGGPADESAFTFGTTGIFSGGVFQTTPTNNALTNLQAGVFQVTAQRALFANLRNASGDEVGTAANPLMVATRWLPAQLVQGVATPTAPVYSPRSQQALSLTTLGALRTDASGTVQPVSGTFFQATQPVSGSVAVWALPPISGTVSLYPTLAVPAGAGVTNQQGIIGLATVVRSSPVYAPGTRQTLSLTTLGALMTDSSATLQPVLAKGVSSTGPSPFLFCDKSVSIDTTASGETQLVALLNGKSIYVCGLDWISTSALSVNFAYGTGSACGTGTTKLEGAQATAANGGKVIPVSPVPKWILPAGQALCINLSAGTQVSGSVTFGQF